MARKAAGHLLALPVGRGAVLLVALPLVHDIPGPIAMTDRATLYCGTALDEPVTLAVCAGQSVVWTRPGPSEGRTNEDAAVVIPMGNGACVLAVADGMGGYAGAAQAARLAVESIAQAVASAAATDDARSAILDAIEQAHTSIRELGIGAGATLVVAEVSDGRVRPYHIGDAGLLVIGQRGLVKLATTPHSPVGYAVEAGVLDADAAMHHAERHLVSNALGADDMHVQVGSPRKLAARDTVLLASDGLLDNLHQDEIVHAVRCGPLAAGATALVARAADRMAGAEPAAPSKPDDCTFVLYRSHAQRRRRGL